ncbi:MAG: 7-carboxy-7-deazaguanine synthase QueE [Proteobacteria bacterium]|nr:7-carboxy-7-deazaguanine synthase QueE [Pseudomonadota bacterium]
MTKPGTYLVKEIFGPTIQGEGAHAGRPCVFLRFAVCNLACTWCDTDFSRAGAERITASEIVARLVELDRHGSRMVVVTGGEPALQWDQTLCSALRDAGFRVHMESNGTRPLGAPVDWLTVSPKPRFHGARDRLLGATELSVSECKVVVDSTVDKTTLTGYEQHYPDASRYLQPCMDDQYEQHLSRTIALITERPNWRLSLQLHKIVGLP